jgi:hypothetical protein
VLDAPTATLETARQERALRLRFSRVERDPDTPLSLQNCLRTIGGTVELTFSPGHGTILTIALPWSPRQPETVPTGLRVQHSRRLR